MTEDTEQDRLAHAAALRARVVEASVDSSTQIEQWLQEDARNVEAWKQVEAPWRLLGEQATAPALIELRRAALAHAHESEASQRSGWKRLRGARMLATAAATVAVAIGVFLLWQASRTQTYRTAAGERRVVTLSDGSEIALDSQSEVRVQYGAHARELMLRTGQARFRVAHDVTRPFSVAARGHEVVATGTAFNVDLLGSDLLVTLIEGHVTVVSENSPVRARGGLSSPSESAGVASIYPGAPIRLDAGEQLVLSPSTAPRVAHVNTDRATAWENGELVFDNEPLSAVVARVSRYGARPIRIRDPQAAALRISGVFHEGDVSGFISTVVSYLPLSAARDRDGSTTLKTRTAEHTPEH